MSNKQKFKYKIFSYVLLLILSIFINPRSLFAESWLKADVPNEKIWIDTSNWQNKRILIEDGYWESYQSKRWVDTSYYITKNKKVWIDTSYTINQGYWKTENYSVWVESGYNHYFTNKRWIDTSHWEARYTTTTSWIPINLTIYSGCTSYGWNMYSFASKCLGSITIRYNGERYLAYKDIIDYKPAYGGSIFAIRYRCYKKEVTSRKVYSVWVTSGYWETFLDHYHVDTSHWETRQRKVWIDTSYTVNQGHWEYKPVKILIEDGYWESYQSKRWVDTSYYITKKVWVDDGYYAEPLKGKIEVYKDPKYIFTRWHKNSKNQEPKMTIKIKWSNFNKEINRIYVYQIVNRYNDKGIDKVDICKKDIIPTLSGSISASVRFNYAGDNNSKVHIYLYGVDNEVAHVYFINPINGYRAININDTGTTSLPDEWLGGEDYGEIEF